MANYRIRNALLKNNVKHWQLAERMGITEFSLSRKLRRELPKEEQKKIIDLIESIKGVD
jgi:hypothetical protein